VMVWKPFCERTGPVNEVLAIGFLLSWPVSAVVAVRDEEMVH